TIQLRRVAGPWLDTETIPFSNLKEFFQLADSSEAHWEHTVSWIDCIGGNGRGVFMRGNHSDNSSPSSIKIGRTITIPFTPSVSMVNRLSLRPFNMLYYNLQARKAGLGHTHYESFFYPL